MKNNRLLQLLPVLFFVPWILQPQQTSSGNGALDPNEIICNYKFHLAQSMNLGEKSINEVVLAMGTSFIGTAYASQTLESPGHEELVVNLQTLDCVTFYENSLVLARCIRKNKTTFDDYKKELQFVRYRGGIINGYASRLHYTSDYFFDNESKSVLKNITRELGGVVWRKKINFMTTHADSYPQLKNSPENMKAVQKIEDEMSARTMYVIPKEDVKKIAPKIKDGDIIGITSTINGLDCNHTGIAVHRNGELRLLHAPITGSKVQMTAVPFWEYLAKIKNDAGIIVARPVEP